MSSEPPIPARFCDGETAALHDVAVTLDARTLAISGAGIDLHWPVTHLLRLPDRPDNALTIGLKGSDARLTVEPEHRAAMQRLLPRLLDRRRARRGTLLLAGGLTILAGSVLAVLFVGLPALSRPLAHAVPIEVEARLGERSNRIVGWFTDECETGETAQAALDRLGSRLYAVSDSPFQYRVRIVDAGFPNAFALPGGHIVVTGELIDAMESPDELAGVLAHEAAHIARRHVMAAQLREMGFGVLLEFLIGGGSGAGQELARTGATLESLRHSRGAEAEADDYALQYLAEAGLNPHGVADFFDRMHDLLENAAEQPAGDGEPVQDDDAGAAPDGEARDTSGRPSWFSTVLRTHPDTAARADAAREAAQGLPWDGTPALTEEEWTAIGAVCDTGVTRNNETLDRVRDRIEDIVRRKPKDEPGAEGDDLR